MEDYTGISQTWIGLLALAFIFATVPFIIKSVWNGFLTELPNVSEIRYAHAVLIILIAAMLTFL